MILIGYLKLKNKSTGKVEEKRKIGSLHKCFFSDILEPFSPFVLNIF